MDQVGRDRPQEGNPEGPMSLATDRKGRSYVLDQVNGRIVRHGADGKADGATPVKLLVPQDLAVGADGSMAVLDRLGDKAVALYSESGALLGQLPLQGEGIEETGLVSGVFVDGEDVYVEREHGPLVKIGDIHGVPAVPRTEVPGRPSRDGKLWIKAGIIDAGAGREYVSAIDRTTSEHRFTRELRLGASIRTIVLLDSDKSGTLYVASEVAVDDGAPFVLLTCLEPSHGAPIGGAIMPANSMPEETFRDFSVLDEGGVLYAQRTEAGVTYVQYSCASQK